MNGEAIGLREIDGLEFDSGVHEVRNEGDIPGEPVELGDYQGRFVNPAGRQGFGELRPVVTMSAFDLRELADGLYAVQVGFDGLPLRLKPEAATALAGRANPVISNILGIILGIHRCYFVCNVRCIEYYN